ncbi:MAG TPA: polyprenol monophosphomannose synthase [Thermoflexales bacterium]|jgi:dolichol-phosphate mannosyltransferase|nr:polyprenol monophosphomannose synthase [Anaerolineae bacterium]HQY23870.1 polyprenol monophosphomannose synthase [Thermoflexales bacterium]HQZ55161.1 polyprenol monophosphomannose synthase [Thermoflexales bacterium]HRA54498.1 polyprenol monophosphomannose synthase [Thermoflexales bacterium]
MRVTVVLPTYNEAENVTLLLPELLALPLSVLVVDDNSPDGTGNIASEWASREPRVSVLRRPGKLGLGTAYVAGFERALADGAEGVLTMDADFSHHPRYIPAILAAAEHADVVIGSRYIPGGDVLYPFHRRFLSKTANFVARAALGLRAHDCTAGFRLYRAAVLRKVPIGRIRSSGYSFLVEMLTCAQRTGIRIAEVPIIFADRERGVSKISSREIFKGMTTVARLFRDRVLGRL